jgi:hypothetical protein
MPTELQSPPAEPFWQKYSNRHEFPLSTVGAVLVHVVAAAFIVYVLFGFANQGTDRAAVPMKLVEGDDNDGEGTTTPGCQDTQIRGESNPFPKHDTASTPDLMALPIPTPTLPTLPVIPDPNRDGAAVAAASPFSKSAKADAKGTPGATRGVGDGKGPAGDANSTGARTQRWILRFRTSDGKDYINQLAALGATVVVPVSADNKQLLYFPDLKDTKLSRAPTAADTRLIAGQVKFSDERKESVAGVVAALKLDFAPKMFWASFPKAVEDELDRKERGYRNRIPENIETTVFDVRVADGKYTLTVIEQNVKR